MLTLRRHRTTFNDYLTRRNLLDEFNEVANTYPIEENIEIIIDIMIDDISDNEDEYVSDIEEMDWDYDTDEDIIFTEIRPWDIDEEN